MTVFDLQARSRLELAVAERSIELSYPYITPDGRHIVVQALKRTSIYSNPYTSDNALLVLSVDGSEVELIAGTGINYGTAALSADGSQVFYGRTETRERSGISDPRRLYSYDRSSGTETRLDDQAFESITHILPDPNGEALYFRYNRPFPAGGGTSPLPQLYPPYLQDMPSWDRPVYFHTYWQFDSPLPEWPVPVVPYKSSYVSQIDPEGFAYGSFQPNSDGLRRQMSWYGGRQESEEARRWSVWRRSRDGELEVLMPVPDTGIGSWSSGPAFSANALIWVGMASPEPSRRRPSVERPSLFIITPDQVERIDPTSLPTQQIPIELDWPDMSER